MHGVSLMAFNLSRVLIQVVLKILDINSKEFLLFDISGKPGLSGN